MARQLSQHLLLGKDLPADDAEDSEGIADLLPVFLGVGVFAANATLSEECGHVGEWGWWSMRKHGHLPARVFGYAFALFAWVRGEEDPAWATFLRPDALAAFQKGLSYLDRTGDSLFHPDTIRRPLRPLPAGELVDRLQKGTASFRLAALCSIREQRVTDPAVVAAVMDCLGDDDPAIPGEAARALAVLGPAAAAAGPLLLKALAAPQAKTRAGAAHALGELRLDPDAVIPELDFLLEDRSPMVVAAAAGALGRFGVAAQPATRRLLAAFHKALIECDDTLINILAAALLAVAPDARQCVREHFTGPHRDLRRLALEALRDQRGQDRTPGDGDDSLTR